MNSRLALGFLLCLTDEEYVEFLATVDYLRQLRVKRFVWHTKEGTNVHPR